MDQFCFWSFRIEIERRILWSSEVKQLQSENTPFVGGKYQCTADLLFDWFRHNQTSKSVHKFNIPKRLNPNQ